MVTAKETVEYDGYYFIDAVSKNGLKLTIPARGYELKSWLAFEKALGSTVEYRAVAEKEWMKTHWTQTPYTELPVTKKPVKKAAKKAPAKKATKKTSKSKKTT
jgi:hypothetical protein